MCRHCERITLVIHLHFHSKSATDYLEHWISIHLSRCTQRFVSITLSSLSSHGHVSATTAIHHFSSTKERIQRIGPTLHSIDFKQYYKSRLKLTRTIFSLLPIYNRNLYWRASHVTCHTREGLSSQGRLFVEAFPCSLIGVGSIGRPLPITNVDYFYIPTESSLDCEFLQTLDRVATTIHLSLSLLSRSTMGRSWDLFF